MEKQFLQMEKLLEGKPFDKGLPIMREVLWKIAEENNTTGPEIFKKYMDWKSNK